MDGGNTVPGIFFNLSGEMDFSSIRADYMVSCALEGQCTKAS